MFRMFLTPCFGRVLKVGLARWRTVGDLVPYYARISSIPGYHQLYSVRTKQSKINTDYSRPPRDESGRIDVSQLVPGSKMILDPPQQAIFDSTEEIMKRILESLKRDLKDLEFRASGRVTPDLLSPVRVQIEGSKPSKIEEMATVGVRDGTTLMITVFDESMTKHIEKAIYATKLPHIVPQRVDPRTLRIPIPKPTVETRKEAFEKASKVAESYRYRVRKENKLVQYRNKFPPRSTEQKEFEKLEHKYLGVIDALLKQMKKDFNV